MAINAKAFGPSQTTRDTQNAIKVAGTANKAASFAGQGVPYAGTVLGLASLFTDPTPQNAGLFAARAATSPEIAVPVANYLSQFGSEAASAGSAAAAGATAGGLGAGLATLPMAMFTPGLYADSLGLRPDGGQRGQNRAERTRDAFELAGPMMRALSPDSVDDFAAPTGGTTAGEGLASTLNFNRSGAWATDTAHNWLPDLSLLPASQGLARLGYRGTSEPKQGRVGGVGEIVAATGGALGRLLGRDRAWLNRAGDDYTGTLYQARPEGVVGGDAPLPAAAYRSGYTDTPATDEGSSGSGSSVYGEGAEQGAHGWNLGLRRLIGAPAGSTVVPTVGPAPWTPQPTEMVAQDEGGQMVPTRYETPQAWTDYMAGLEDFDPALAERIGRHAQSLDDNRRAGAANIPGGP